MTTFPLASTATAVATCSPAFPYDFAQSAFPVGSSFTRSTSLSPALVNVLPPTLIVPWKNPTKNTLPLASAATARNSWSVDASKSFAQRTQS